MVLYVDVRRGVDIARAGVDGGHATDALSRRRVRVHSPRADRRPADDCHAPGRLRRPRRHQVDADVDRSAHAVRPLRRDHRHRRRNGQCRRSAGARDVSTRLTFQQGYSSLHCATRYFRLEILKERTRHLVPCGRLSWLLPAFDRTLISHSYLLAYLDSGHISLQFSLGEMCDVNASFNGCKGTFCREVRGQVHKRCCLRGVRLYNLLLLHTELYFTVQRQYSFEKKANTQRDLTNYRKGKRSHFRPLVINASKFVYTLLYSIFVLLVNVDYHKR